MMSPDKIQHLIAGLIISVIPSMILVAGNVYDKAIEVSNFSFPVWAVPLVAVVVAAIWREIKIPPFSVADIFATFMGGLLGCAAVYSLWFYLIVLG